jgi:predicted dinucleotide-binding enzyme
MKRKVAIIGKGNVGGAISRGLARAGYETKTVGKDPSQVRETAKWGDVVVLAVPYAAVDETLREVGDGMDGKLLIDATNPLTSDLQLAVGFQTSAAEELQKKAPKARVAKAFNTVFAKNMESGRVKGEPIALLVASDDPQARQQALALGRDLGFDAVDAGPLRNARWLEALAYLTIQLGYAMKMGTDIGFRLVH